MFERFTNRARRVLVIAQEEARLLDHPFIGPEHLLLGLVREAEGIPARVLDQLGFTVESVRSQVAERIGTTGGGPGSPPFTPGAKEVLNLAVREARHSEGGIGPEHLLLGLLDLGDSGVTAVLATKVANLSDVRDLVVTAMGQQASRSDPAQPVPFWARFIAKRRTRAMPQGAPVTGGSLASPGVRFPDDWDRVSVGDVSAAAQVDLTSHSRQHIEGMVSGLPVDVRVAGSSHRATLKGMIGTHAVSGSWEITDNSPTNPVEAKLRATLAARPVEVVGSFLLGPQWLLDHGDITGHIDDRPLEAQVRPAAGGFDSSSTVAVTGTLGDAAVVVYASVAGSLTKAVALGSIGEHQVRLDVTATTSRDGRSRHVTGRWDGPSEIALLAIGALLYFI